MLLNDLFTQIMLSKNLTSRYNEVILKKFKKNINGAIYRHINNGLNLNEDSNLEVNYFLLDTDYSISLRHDEQNLSFDFFDDLMTIEMIDPANPTIRFEINDIDKFKLLESAIDFLVELFVHNNWHISVGILSVSYL